MDNKPATQPILRMFLTSYNDAAILVLRVLAGGMMLSHGVAKMSNVSTIPDDFADPFGLGPVASYIMIMLAESVGSLFVMAGFITRLSAAAILFGMLVAAFIAHSPFSFSGSELPLAYSVMFAVVVIAGGGKYSLDAIVWGKCCRKQR